MDFLRVTALVIRFHEMIASSTAYFRLLELEYSSVTGFYLAFPHLLGCSSDISTLEGGVTCLMSCLYSVCVFRMGVEWLGGFVVACHNSTTTASILILDMSTSVCILRRNT